MKVENMTSSNGNKIANQFVIWDDNGDRFFQSYSSIIAKVSFEPKTCKKTVTLDEKDWDYSKTTGKYRNQFLGETKNETEKKIKSGVYILADLNS